MKLNRLKIDRIQRVTTTLLIFIGSYSTRQMSVRGRLRYSTFTTASDIRAGKSIYLPNIKHLSLL